jgi:hypothetical protein
MITLFLRSKNERDLPDAAVVGSNQVKQAEGMPIEETDACWQELIKYNVLHNPGHPEDTFVWLDSLIKERPQMEPPYRLIRLTYYTY